MKHWTGESVFRDPGSPEIVRAAADALMARFREIECVGYPRLISVSHTDGHDDDYEYEVVVELAPGVVMPVECGLLESLNEGWDEPMDADGIVGWTMEGVETCMPVVGRLSDQLHTVRSRARQIIGGWARTGIQSHLVEVRLAAHDTWRGSGEPSLVLLVEGCDDQLRTMVAEVRVENPSALEKALDAFRDELAHKLEARARVARLGASGSIDQLALNAIAHFGEVAKALRRFSSERQFWLADSTSLRMEDGEVTAGTGKPNATVHFSRGVVTFFDKQVPHTLLTAATGRPVSVIAEHPFLTDDMIVVEANCSLDDDGMPFVTVKLDMPQWLFCTATGRTWRSDAPEGLAGSGDSVVALCARSG